MVINQATADKSKGNTCKPECFRAAKSFGVATSFQEIRRILAQVSEGCLQCIRHVLNPQADRHSRVLYELSKGTVTAIPEGAWALWGP